MFTKDDIRQIEAHGLSVAAVERQLENFRNGFPYPEIVSAASLADGTIMDTGDAAEDYAARYDGFGGKPVKFVPASGAATRMFKDLFEFLATGKPNKVTEAVLAGLDGFAFAGRLRESLPKGADGRRIIESIVGPPLNYGSMPKALILFHKYPEGSRTALEEHLVEGEQYASHGDEARIHFTVSPEHRIDFEALLSEVLPIYGKRFGVRYAIEMSVQESSTDTIAVNTDDTPFRNADGSLLFRPAGHGALIGNLDSIEADLIFIKNIDNVTVDALRGDTVKHKKILAGVLLSLQERAFAYLRYLDKNPCSPEFFDELRGFLENDLHIALPESFSRMDSEKLRAAYRRLLDRPIRVCGMVRNEGEPGGGPFMVRNSDGTVSPQILESSQVAPQYAHMMKASTHFNPVDIVCGVKDYRGRKFGLHEYVDHSAGFISLKSKDGRELKAQEVPGLWNGAMADWITVFAEVPISTFTPVKVVTDLLRPEHRE